MPLTEIAVVNGGGMCRWTDPVYSDGKIVFTTSAGFIYCVDTLGGVIWSKDVGTPRYFSGIPAIYNSVVYVQMVAKDTTYRFYALNLQNGDTIWSRPLPSFSLYSQPLVEDGSIYFGGFGGCIYRWDATDGHQIWGLNVGGAIFSACAYSKGIIFTTSYGTGKLYAIDTTGGIIWERYIGPSTTAPTIANNKVFTINRTDGLTSCFDAVTGDSIWQVFTQTNDGSTFAADESLLYFGTYRGKKFYCLRQSNGSVKWQKPIGGANGQVSSAVAINGGFFFGTCWDGNLYIHNKYTGQKLYEILLSSNGSTSSIGIAKGFVFVGDEEGRLHIFKGTGFDEAPSEPTGLTAKPGNESVYLWWNKNIESDLSGYIIYHRLDSEFSYSFEGFTTDTFYVDAGLFNDSLYYFVVVAVDTAGSFSGYSNEVSAIPGDTVRSLPISDLVVSSGVDNSEIVLTFTSVGDDSTTGNASGYEIRYYNLPINDEWTYDISNIFPNTFIPQSPGNIETFTLTGLNPGDTLYFSVKAFDEVNNYSLLGNTDSGVVKSDLTPPSPITDLVAYTGLNAGEVILNFTASGDDGNLGNTSGYIIKYNSGPITDLNWDVSILYENTFIPKSPGQSETLVVSGLTPNDTLWFGIKVYDEKPNYSSLSNSDSAVVCYDPIPPASITDLSATTGVYEEEVNLSWTATGDDGNIGTAKLYILKYSNSPITNDIEFDLATTYSQDWTPLEAGSPENKTLTGFPNGDTLWFSIKAYDDGNNLSSLGNTDSAIVQIDNIPPSSITTLTASTGSKEEEVNLTWTAVGDNSNFGPATGYILKYSSSPITNESEFELATTYIQNWIPSQSGLNENKLLTGLSPGAILYFSIKAFDEVPNIGSIGNSPSALVQTDVTPPAKITDLFALTCLTIDSSIILSWTAVGDDSMTGQAFGYIVKYFSIPIVSQPQWDEAILYNQTWVPKQGGEAEVETLYSLPYGTWYFAIMVQDEVPNFSPISNTDSCKVAQVGISEVPDKLFLNIPSNPALNRVDIKFGLPRKMYYNLKILNMSGRIEKELKGIYGSGIYKYSIYKIPSGIYFAVLESDNERIVKRFVFLR